MRLGFLELEHWACHDRMNVDLSQGLEIAGRNGTGKSSILAAIRFAFAESARGYAGKIKNGTRSSQVTLTFTHDGAEYRIEKRLFVDKPSAAELAVNGQIAADNPSSVSQALGQVLSESVLDRLLFVPQGQLTRIVTDLTQKGGKAELDTLFGLDRLERVYQKAGEDIKEAQGALKVREQQLARFADVVSQGYERESEELREKTRESQRVLAEKQEERGDVEQRYRVAELRCKKLEDGKRKADLLKRELAKAEVEHAGATKDLALIAEKRQSLETKKEELSGLRKNAEGLKRFLVIQERLTALERVAQRLKELADDADEKRLKGLHAEVAAGEGLREAEKDLRRRLDEAKRKQTECATKRAEQEGYRKDLSSLSADSRCPRCGQPLCEDHIVGEKKAADEAIAALRKEEEQTKSSVSDADKKLAGLEEKLSLLQGMAAQAKVLEAELEKRTIQKEDLGREESRIRKGLDETGYRGEPPSDVAGFVADYNRMAGRIEGLEKEVAAERGLTEKQKALEAREQELSQTITAKKKGLEGLEVDEDAHRTAVGERDRLRESLFALASAVEKQTYALRDLERQLAEREKKKQECEVAKRERDMAAKKVDVLRRARDVFHTNKGLPRYLRERYLAKLNELLAYFFATINQNPRYRGVAFTDDYALELSTMEGTLTLSQLSGGEHVQLALALRLALIELLSPIRLLILDEPFGSLDEAHRELLGEALNKVAAQGQLVLVTHIPVESLQLPAKLELGEY